jgi:GcrA cell cycle regulator
MDWNDEIIARLRVLWAEGHSTAEIGRRLGVSKNAVVGKAHRLNLPARPSPIRREGSGAPRPPVRRRVAGPTLPPLASSAPPMQVAAAAPAMRPPVAVRAPIAAPAPRPVAVPRPFARTVTCCWPIGEPGTPSFRFCDADASTGKPYCTEHAALAYVKVRDRREDAA